VFYLLIVFVFTADPFGMADMASRQVLAPKFEPTMQACKADAIKALSMQTPDGVTVGVKCDGPLTDPSVPMLRN